MVLTTMPRIVDHFPTSAAPIGSIFSATRLNLIRSLRPNRVFDAGCALGLLVEGFWDRGVETYGRDILQILPMANIPAPNIQYCEVGSIGRSLTRRVWHRLHASKFSNTCRKTSRCMPSVPWPPQPHGSFSSPHRRPTSADEPTHINVHPPSTGFVGSQTLDLLLCSTLMGHFSSSSPSFSSGLRGQWMAVYWLVELKSFVCAWRRLERGRSKYLSNKIRS